MRAGRIRTGANTAGRIGVLHHQATGGEMGREHRHYLAAREAEAHKRTADRSASPVPERADRPHQEPQSHQQGHGRQDRETISKGNTKQ